MNRMVSARLAILLVAIGLLAVGCAETKQPISRDTDKCLVRACSVFY